MIVYSCVLYRPCFIGCSLGGVGLAAKYTYLDKEKLIEFGSFNSYRCEAAGDPYSLCAQTHSPPPPPAKSEDEILFRYSGVDTPSDFSSSHSAFYKLVATDVAMPADFRGYTTYYNCIAEDDGASKCARHCSENLKVSFQLLNSQFKHS